MPTTEISSPNTSIRPATACVNEQDHLVIGGCDTVELATRFGTPLYVVDEETIVRSAKACLQGLKNYPKARVLYAGKAFLCLAMCKLVQKLGLGLDVVSEGELFTAACAGFPSDLIYLHGNNKSAIEISNLLQMPGAKIIIDNPSELELTRNLAQKLEKKANILLRVIPGVEPDTHAHIVTGHSTSKFGIPLEQLDEICQKVVRYKNEINFVGLHAHIGSQSHELKPFEDSIEVLADCMSNLQNKYRLTVSQLDVGGGLGIAYTEKDQTLPMEEWSRSLADAVLQACKKRKLNLPELLLEPGRAIVGTAGVTLYTAGHIKNLPDGTRYVAVDGGMADNPRPIIYQAEYTACVANRVSGSTKVKQGPSSLVGKYCESGDVLIQETPIAPDTGDLIAVFSSGAYHYSQASNYNRTGKPACVLVKDGNANVIIARETIPDLLTYDRIPDRLI
jgi:diaminopimelate decarboxylase